MAKSDESTLPALKLPPHLYEPFMEECTERNMKPAALMSQLIWLLVQDRKRRLQANWKAVSMELARELQEIDPHAALTLADILKGDDEDDGDDPQVL